MGYREEDGVDPLSSTETFVALKLHIDNWRWAGVPVYIRTGKCLPRRTTEVIMEFRRPPHLPLFPAEAVTLGPDVPIARVQPDEGISLRFGAKVPGHEFRIRKASMDFSYSHGYGESRDDAYERVILDALIGDATLFIRADEVARSWRIVDPLLAYWRQAPDPIPLYHAGPWGPKEATQLIENSRPPMARPLTPWRCRRLVSLYLEKVHTEIGAGKIRKRPQPVRYYEEDAQ